jgi:multidrug efflux pump subunit AcrA (membrane-fusion protein)
VNPFAVTWGIRAAVAIGLCLVLFSAVKWHDHKIRTDEAGKWRPRVEAAELRAAQASEALAKLTDSYKAQTAAMAELEKRSKALIAAKDKALLALAAKERTLRSEVERLKEIVAGPPAPTAEKSCADATDILSRLAAWRLRGD